MTIRQDIQRLDPGKRVEMFELDASALGGGILYFCANTSAARAAIVWQGNTYTPWAIEVTGFEVNGRGQLPTPRLKASNLGGAMVALALAYDDLVGAKLTRRRTLSHYLDGEPGADPEAGFPDDVFYIERKLADNPVYLEWELSSAMDVEGVMLPKRQVLANLCGSQYRSAECSYAGGAVATADDVPTAVLAEDDCSRRLSGCKLRFGAYGPLPFGGFPGVGKR